MINTGKSKTKEGRGVPSRQAAAALCVFVMLFLIFSLAMAVLRPKDINYYENRLAEQLPALSAESFSDGSFQDDMESALADQIPGAQRLKKSYNGFWSAFSGRLISALSERFPDSYFNYGDISVFGSRIVYPMQSYADREEALQKQADAYARIAAENPDVAFFAYVVETDADISFDSGEKRHAAELIREKFSFAETGCFELESFEQYCELFYRSDHHWNYKGSYLAYCEIARLLGYEPLEAGEALQLSESFMGNKALGYLELDYSEPFFVYDLDYPEMSCFADGEDIEDFGRIEALLSGTGSGSIGYGVYGNDYGEAILRTGRDGLDDILILGDSYDNALIKPIASHFDTTHSIDLRYYNEGRGGFNVNDYIEEHGIEVVLFVGSSSVFFGSEDFITEG